MNRIQHLFDEPSEHPSAGEFFVVAGEFGRVFVTREVAEALRATFRRLIVPTWLEFRDQVGSLVRVRSRHVMVIVESTPETRAADRRHDEARSAEENSNRRPWDTD
jgi:hypothetical protein